MLIIGLSFPSPITCEEDLKEFKLPREHGITWDWKKRGNGWKCRTMARNHITFLNFNVKNDLFAILGLIPVRTWGPDKIPVLTRSPTGIKNVYKTHTLTHNLVNRSESFRIVVTDSSCCIYLGSLKYYQMDSEGVWQTDKYSPTDSDLYLLTVLNSMAFVWN